MAKYCKKSVVIEAHRWDPHEKPTEMPDWLWKHLSLHPAMQGEAVEIRTLEGVMLAQPGDWIIKGVKGELYPCKPDVFAATYEESPDA